MIEAKAFAYRKEVGNGLVVLNTQPEHAAPLEELQRIVYPTLAESSIIREQHYRDYVRVFPEGQFVVEHKGRVIGMTTSIRHHLLLNEAHTFDEMLHGDITIMYEPLAEWLYGLDIGTHPDYRGLGIAGYLYDARQETVRRLKLKGQFTYGMLNGYGALQHKMTAQEYYEQVVTGKIKDPTVSRQMKNGFAPAGLVAGYVDDPVCAGYCAFLIRENEELKK